MARGPESGIQSRIVRALHATYDCRCAANHNGGFRTKTEALVLKDTGGWAGYPDVTVFGRASAIFLVETKAKIQVRERGIDPFQRFHSLSTSQKLAVPELRQRGFMVAVTDDVDEALACAAAAGLTPRSSAPAFATAATGF